MLVAEGFPDHNVILYFYRHVSYVIQEDMSITHVHNRNNLTYSHFTALVSLLRTKRLFPVANKLWFELRIS